MTNVQDDLTRLLTQMQTGWADNVLRELPDRASRNAPGAQAFARQFDSMLDGVRPVSVSGSNFRGDVREGRLIVTGQITLDVRDPVNRTRQINIVAEFVDREGAPALVRIALP